MIFRKGNIAVRLDADGFERTLIVTERRSLTDLDADDLLAALWVSHLARQGVDDETLRIGADMQGVAIER